MCINKDRTEGKYCDIWCRKNQGLHSKAAIKGADVWHLTNEIFDVKLFQYIKLKDGKLAACCNEHIFPLKRIKMGNLAKHIC